MTCTTDQEWETRRDAVEQALASVRLEGLEPGTDAEAIYRRFADGELTVEEMGSQIESLHDRAFGSLSLSRHASS